MFTEIAKGEPAPWPIVDNPQFPNNSQNSWSFMPSGHISMD
jgi:hypothetical protein